MLRRITALFGLVIMGAAYGQEAGVKPGPEHAILKQMVGRWDAEIKAAGSESKGTMNVRLDLGDLWCMTSFTGEMGGQKYQGRGMDTYDVHKKKYVSIWVDSMSTSPTFMEGTYDERTKTLTMTGEGVGPTGEKMKMKNVTKFNDKDSFDFKMYLVAGGSDTEMMSIHYKKSAEQPGKGRKKKRDTEAGSPPTTTTPPTSTR